MKKINKQSGFTLIELLVTLAIVSVIMVLGINKLRDYNDYKRMELQVKRLDDTATYIQNYTYNYGIPATFAQLTEKSMRQCVI
ncbi:type II secretion system protein [Photobacterium leiognathi]|uniref:type II secretion system protein n=1 Tax=Photobacterium leiognathi TaxID=553611 RepID=UPI00273A51AA|nr:type II secretion system protein [Photobacterium leiognathi]